MTAAELMSLDEYIIDIDRWGSCRAPVSTDGIDMLRALAMPFWLMWCAYLMRIERGIGIDVELGGEG